ncbi:zinc-binding dehydrogenase [Microbacterium sp.]|uniref:zinc-binding dehydrogenase n=1 Tax=Microbacterium sp. TaxID=51671 RepID=UPI003C718682
MTARDEPLTSIARRGASRIILMGRHGARTALGEEFGATDFVEERDAAGIAHVLDLTDGLGTDVVVDAVGHFAAYEQACGVVRPGGTLSRVGVPQ